MVYLYYEIVLFDDYSLVHEINNMHAHNDIEHNIWDN